MAIRSIGGGDLGLLRTAANIEETHQDTIKVGHIVRAGTSSNYCVNSTANNTSFQTIPMGRVVSIEKGSKVCTVEWFNVRAMVTQKYSTVGSRSSNVIVANDKSTITGSVTCGAQDRTYIWGVDTGNTTMTFLVL